MTTKFEIGDFVKHGNDMFLVQTPNLWNDSVVSFNYINEWPRGFVLLTSIFREEKNV